MNWKNFDALGAIKGMGIILLSLVVILAVLFFDVDAAEAHGPHDVVIDVELSPDYRQDRTAYYLLDSYLPIWGNLFKSEDGGESWRRIEKTLDNQHKLSSLAVSTQFKDILFLSTLGDGIYKSVNGGESWHQVNQGLKTLSIDSVVIAPDSSEVVLAAGTERGLYRTEDGGKNWQQVISKSKISAIASDQQQTIVGDREGNLYASENGGKSWQRLFTLDSGAVRAIAISPRFIRDRTILVGTEKGIWQTKDGGVAFSQVKNGIGDRHIMSLAVSPDYDTDATILASTWHDGIFRSTDGGKTWTKHSKGLKKTSQADTKLYKSPHFSDLSISQSYSQDGTAFLAGFDGLFKSTDGGRSWRDVNIGKGATSLRNLAISPNYQNDATIAVSTLYQGVYLSHDAGNTWKEINNGLGLDRLLKQNLITQTGDLIFSPNYSADNTILASSWGCLFKTTNGGKQWHKFWVPKRFRRDSYMVVSPNFASDRTIYFVTLPGKILKSTDGGKNFSLAGEVDARAAFIPSLVISPNFGSDRTLYLGNFTDGVYKSVDGGATWQLANNGLIAKDDYAKLTISPNYQEDRTLFAGTAEGLYVTQDGGSSWRKFTDVAYGENSYIETVAVSPDFKRDRTFLVSVRGEGLFRTTDGGATFTQIGNYLTGPIEFSPSYERDRTIYSSSGGELYQTTDGGDTWQTLVFPQPQYNFATILYHLATNSPERKYLLASIAAIFVYLLVGYLKLGKRWSLKKWHLKTSGAFTAFIIVSLVLST